MTHKNFKKARKFIATEHLKKIDQSLVYEYFSTSELEKRKKYGLVLDLADIVMYQRTVHYLVSELNCKVLNYCPQDLYKVSLQPSSAEYRQFIAKD